MLTDKQIKKLENSNDKHSARCVTRVGEERKLGRFFKKTYFLADKLIFKMHKCPTCKSTNSFHKRSQDIFKLDNKRNYDNVYKTYTKLEGDTRLFHKIDYCLDCHNEFSIEMFLWVKV